MYIIYIMYNVYDIYNGEVCVYGKIASLFESREAGHKRSYRDHMMINDHMMII